MSDPNVCEVYSIFDGSQLYIDAGSRVLRNSEAIDDYLRTVELRLAQIALDNVPGQELDKDAQILELPLSS